MARTPLDRDAPRTSEERRPLQRPSQQEPRRQADAAYDAAARRWAVGIIVADVLGLPALLLLTPWPWYLAVAGWLAMLALVVVLGVHACESRRRHRSRSSLPSTDRQISTPQLPVHHHGGHAAVGRSG